MTASKTTPPEDRIILRSSLPIMQRAAKARGRYLAWWPLDEANKRLIVIRTYASSESADEAQSLIYLRLVPPAANP